MRTEPADHLTPCWLPLRARDGVAPWPDVARAKIIPALTGGSN